MKPVGPVFDRSWRASCSVEPVGKSDVDWMVRRHYIGKHPGVCVLRLALLHNGFPVGCVLYALPPRETSKRYGGNTWELARLWVDDAIPTNAETFLIARSIAYIRQHHKDVEFLVSYADPSVGHQGTIYRAANWTPDGATDDGRKSPRCDYACAATGKMFSRKSHVPIGTETVRLPRTRKARFVYHVNKTCGAARLAA